MVCDLLHSVPSTNEKGTEKSVQGTLQIHTYMTWTLVCFGSTLNIWFWNKKVFEIKSGLASNEGDLFKGEGIPQNRHHYSTKKVLFMTASPTSQLQHIQRGSVSNTQIQMHLELGPKPKLLPVQPPKQQLTELNLISKTTQAVLFCASCKFLTVFNGSSM